MSFIFTSFFIITISIKLRFLEGMLFSRSPPSLNRSHRLTKFGKVRTMTDSTGSVTPPKDQPSTERERGEKAHSMLNPGIIIISVHAAIIIFGADPRTKDRMTIS